MPLVLFSLPSCVITVFSVALIAFAWFLMIALYDDTIVASSSPRHPIAATFSPILSCQKARSPVMLLFAVTKRPSSARPGRICVVEALPGGSGRGGTMITTGGTGGGGGGGGGGGLVQPAMLASSPTTMIFRNNFMLHSPAAKNAASTPRVQGRFGLLHQ